MSESRKPIVLAGVLTLAIVVAFVVAAGFGGRGSDAGGDWSDFLNDLGGSSSLRPDDLRLVDGGCEVSAAVIAVTGFCVLEVAGFGGGSAFGDVVKKATIVAMDGPMQLTVVVEGTTVSQTIDEGEQTQLTFGTSGGELGLACVGFGVSSCSADIRY